jgi:uncharacterized protein
VSGGASDGATTPARYRDSVPMQLTAVRRYPVKSCRGEDLDRAVVEPWGLAGDRRFMLVDDGGDVVTAREHPTLLLATPTVADGELRVTLPDRPDLSTPIPDGTDVVPVKIFSSKLDVALAAAPAHEWFSDLIGVRVRLVYLDDPTRRRPNPMRSRPDDRVSLADGYPLHLTNEASLSALCSLAETPLSMIRFRPNVVVSGAPAWEEDSWRLLRVGDVRFRVVKSCDRCVMTTVDPQTGRRGKEPIATLARHRRWDGVTWFGVNLIPDDVGTIRPGDPLEVLERADTSEPLR